jgi:hypothetical protein
MSLTVIFEEAQNLFNHLVLEVPDRDSDEDSSYQTREIPF